MINYPGRVGCRRWLMWPSMIHFIRVCICMQQWEWNWCECVRVYARNIKIDIGRANDCYIYCEGCISATVYAMNFIVRTIVWICINKNKYAFEWVGMKCISVALCVDCRIKWEEEMEKKNLVEFRNTISPKIDYSQNVLLVNLSYVGVDVRLNRFFAFGYSKEYHESVAFVL